MEGQLESLELIRTMEESLADLSGDEFFVSLVITLARSLDVHCAFVTEFVDENSRVHPLAMWCDGGLQPPMHYPIAGSPCEAVLNGDVVSFDSGVVELFPDDRAGLQALGADSFLAIPLKNRLGRVIGHVALMDDRPRDWDESDISVLRLFAARATTEVERRQFEAELTETNRLLEARMQERTRELAEANERLLREIDRERALSEALAESEAGFRALFEHSPVSIWELDLSQVRIALDDLRRDGASDLADHLRRHPRTRDEVLGKAVIRRFNRASLALFGIAEPRSFAREVLAGQPPDALDALVDTLAELHAGARVGDREMRQRRADGTTLDCHVFWSVPPGNEATWSRLLVSFVDLTEQTRVSQALTRVQVELEARVAERTAALSAVNTRLRHEIATRTRAEQALIEREAAYRDLYENAPNVYWSTGADGLIRRANAQAAKLFGYPSDEIVGKPLLDMLADTPHGKEVGRRVFQRFLEGKATLGQEVEFRAADGHSVWVDVNVVPILDDEGAPVATRSMLTDVTARKQAQAELARRLELDQMVLDVSTVLAGAGALGIDTDLARVLAVIGERGGWDQVALDFAGGPEPGHVHWQRNPGAAALASPAGSFATIEGPLWQVPDAPDHDDRPDCVPDCVGAGCSYVAMPLRRGGAMLGVLQLLAGVDREPLITPRDEHIMALLGELLGGTLARCAAERDLVAAKRVAESASQAKSDFLASMSHELRTPLNVILGYAQLLRRQPDLDVSVRDKLATLQRSGEHLLHLIDDVLQLARVEAGKIVMDPRPVDLDVFLQELSEMFGARVRERDMAFCLEVSQGVPGAVMLDERRLRQVLINLLSNAVKFSPAGTAVTLAVDAQATAPGWWELRFAVSDQGSGIDATNVERIFEPFVQLGDAVREGVGLGLAITRTLVTAMAGQIALTSAPGAGTTFTVTLPARQADRQEPAQTPAPIRGYTGRRRTLLLADDHAENRALLAEYLQNLGFEVIEAADGAEAVRAAQAHAPDLALIDLLMPVLDGYQAIGQLRAQVPPEALRIIAVSASAFDSDRLASLSCGSDVFLAKPLDLEELASAIAQLLEIEWLRDGVATPGHGTGYLPDTGALTELRRAAELGDVSAIEAWLGTRLEAAPGDALLNRLREHLKRFDVRAIQSEIRDLEAPS